MYRRLLGLLVIGLLGGAAWWSGSRRPSHPDAPPGLRVAVEDHNPWTHLRLNNDPADFQFAIVSDRTSDHRPGVFSRAVAALNLMQPQFVLSVGDLVEGSSEDRAVVEGEWREFETEVGRLRMPFFYVPGNHDLANPLLANVWRERHGRRHYHFVYRDVLFLVLNSEEQPGPGGGLGLDQLADVRRALEDNRGVRWTVVLLHRPLWDEALVQRTGWLEVEKMLADRPYTVFAGHIHSYRKYVRQGRDYYQLATTGGGSDLRGPEKGEVDHVAWVTMKSDGPVIANLLLDGVRTDDLKRPGEAK
jgi:hypothetical protein